MKPDFTDYLLAAALLILSYFCHRADAHLTYIFTPKCTIEVEDNTTTNRRISVYTEIPRSPSGCQYDLDRWRDHL